MTTAINDEDKGENSMTCAVCNSVEGNVKCNNVGQTCDTTKDQMCQTVVRKENGLPARFEKRCKQRQACLQESAMYKAMGLCKNSNG